MRNPITITVPNNAPIYVDGATATPSEVSAALKTFCVPSAREDLAWATHLAVGDAHRTEMIERGNNHERTVRTNNRPGQKITFH